jgi:hypothetical protein
MSACCCCYVLNLVARARSLCQCFGQPAAKRGVCLLFDFGSQQVDLRV